MARTRERLVPLWLVALSLLLMACGSQSAEPDAATETSTSETGSISANPAEANTAAPESELPDSGRAESERAEAASSESESAEPTATAEPAEPAQPPAATVEPQLEPTAELEPTPEPPAATESQEPIIVSTSETEPTPIAPQDDGVAPECRRLTSFATDTEQALWWAVNDGVMGGRSSGGPTFTDTTMTFAGEINTNGGGFSSVRVGLLPGALEGYSQIVVRAKTDGRTYKLIFDDELEGRDRRISHQDELRLEPSDDWQIGVVQFENLRSSLFGRSVQTEPFRPDLATQMGIQISDGIDGSFEIEIDWIEACQ